MSDPFLPESQVRIRQAFLLGLSRTPLALSPALSALVPAGKPPALAVLALAGQRQRFAPPPTIVADEVPEAARAMHQDPRPVLSPAARRAFVRLTISAEKPVLASVISLAVGRIARAGCRVHPFDLPGIGRHVRAEADRLGMAERAYLALTAPNIDEDVGKGLFFERITPDNWSTFSKGQRHDFLKEQRREDPTAARALLEAVWKAEPGPTRLALLEAMAVNLGDGDKPFLVSLEKDRSEGVRAAAARLVMRIPSSETYEARLAAATACFSRPSKTGLGAFVRSLAFGSDEAALQFKLPPADGGVAKTPSEHIRFNLLQLEQLFAGLPLDALANAAKAMPEEIVAALPIDDHAVLAHFVETARASDDDALVAKIVGARLLSTTRLPVHLVVQLVQSSRTVLAPEVAHTYLAAPHWVSTLAEVGSLNLAKDDGRLVFIAALMPREAAPAFVASLGMLLPSVTRGARDFADLIDNLPDNTPVLPSGAAA